MNFIGHKITVYLTRALMALLKVALNDLMIDIE